MKTTNIYQFSVVLIAVLLMAACQNETRQAPAESPDPEPEAVEEAVIALPSLPYFALFDEQEEQLEIEKHPDFDTSQLHVDSLTNLLRLHYPEVPLVVDTLEGDTLYVSITDATFLTQQMGSSGAKVYLLEATYAFTELRDIDVVHFNFTEGDHAMPGVYTRERFEKENLAIKE